MSKRIPVPNLQDKLDLLLRYDNVLKTRTDLAKELKINPSQISRWQTGGDYGDEAKDLVPRRHYERLLELFDVSDEWMKMAEDPKSPGQLKSRLEAFLTSRPPRSGWQKLFLEADISDLLSIKRTSKPPGRKSSLRGLAPVNHPDGFLGERFYVGEKVYIELRVSTPWRTEPLAHLVLLMIEGGQPKCLCPSEWYRAASHEVTDTRVTIPHGAPAEELKVTPPVGILSLFAILTREPLPPALYDELMRPDHPDLRDCLARVSSELGRRTKGSWCCFKQHCYVEQSP